MLKIFRKKRRKLDDAIIDDLKEEINELIEEKKQLIQENEELRKAINVLQNEKSKRINKEQINRTKWLHGYHGEKYSGGDY